MASQQKKNHLPPNINNATVEKNIFVARIMVWDSLGMEEKARNIPEELREGRLAEELLQRQG